MVPRGVTGLALVAGLGAVAAKVALSAPRLQTQAASAAITWLIVTSFVVVGWALLATDLPRANGWACLLVAAATVPGELNQSFYSHGFLVPLGYTLDPLYLAAAVALVLRYPRARLTVRERQLVTLLIAASSVMRALTVLTTGNLPDGLVRPRRWAVLGWDWWWHDWAFVRVGHAVTVLLLLTAGSVLIGRVFTGPGLTRRSLAPLALIGGVCALAASTDQAIWALNLSRLHLSPPALVRDLSASLIPVALLADLLRRRAAMAAVSEKVLTAARSGDAAALQRALRQVLVDPTVTVTLTNGQDNPADPTVRPRPEVQPQDRRIDVVSLDDGTPLMEISCNPKSVGDGSLLRMALTGVRLGAENLRLNAELLLRLSEISDSRTRIVEAGLSERRRVERDLHDGAQQRLLAVAATLAQADLVGDEHIRGVVTAAQAGLAGALRELRELARGIHPAALNLGGLPAALPILCVNSSTQTTTVHVDHELATRRPPAAHEAAIYFLVAEALTNAARHAGAGHVGVDVHRDDDGVHTVIRDDGAGTAEIVPGGGLAGLQDRFEALGGRFGIHTDPCGAHPDWHGTTLTAHLPVSADTA